MSRTIITVCANCQRTMHVPDRVCAPVSVSHGLCERCVESILLAEGLADAEFRDLASRVQVLDLPSREYGWPIDPRD